MEDIDKNYALPVTCGRENDERDSQAPQDDQSQASADAVADEQATKPREEKAHAALGAGCAWMRSPQTRKKETRT